MTWNVQNLFTPGDADGPDSQAAYDAKVASLAAVIDTRNPDVLALQEVGSAAALADLQAALTRPLPHAAAARPDPRGIRVAFLSKLPLGDIAEFETLPAPLRPVQARDPRFDDPATPDDESLTARMGRAGLRVTVEVDGQQLWLLTAHLKSKLIVYPTDRRGARFAPTDEAERARYAAYALYRRTIEAVTVRDQVNQLLEAGDGDGLGRQRPVVVLGDLNDEPHAATTQILQGPGGSQIPLGPDGHVAFDGSSAFARPDAGDAWRLWNLTPLIPPARRVTRVYKGRGEVIDHILTTRALTDPDQLPAVDTAGHPHPLPSMGDDPTTRRNQPGSDHAAVIATLTLTGDP